MQKFLKSVLIFLLPFILGFVILEYLLRHIPNDYTIKKQYMDQHADSIQVLIFGSSHSMNGINPDYFSVKAYNTAHEYQSLKYDYFIFHKYIDQMSSLKTIFVPISYFTLFGEVESSRIKSYRLYYQCEYPHELKHYFEVPNWKLMSELEHIYQYYVLDSIQSSCQENGYKLYNQRLPDDIFVKNAKIDAIKQTNMDSNALNNNVKILENWIEECEAKNINVYLFTPPALDVYRKYLNKTQLLKTEKVINHLKMKYKNVTYRSFLDDPRFMEEEFCDAHHLMGKGATKFSKILNEELGYQPDSGYIRQ